MQSTMATRPAIFKWRQTEPALILCAVRWYLRDSLSLRDVQELLEERGLEADRTTVWRWVQRYSPELEQRLRRYLKPTNKSWRVDETYVRVRAVGATCIEPSSPPAPRLPSCFRRRATPAPPTSGSARRSAVFPIRSLASLIRI